MDVGSDFSVGACIKRVSGCQILSGESQERLGSQFGKRSEVQQNDEVPEVLPWLDIAKPILPVFMGRKGPEGVDDDTFSCILTVEAPMSGL